MGIKLIIKQTISLIIILLFTNSFAQKLRVGSRMPQFELIDQNGEYFNSSEYLNKKNIVVFFYTEDDAPICTREVIEFNNNIGKFDFLNTIVVGINPASVVYHRKFVVKLELKYQILYDRNGEIQKKFNVPNVKRTKNPQRYTFIINKKGFIKKIFHYDDNAEIHVIEALKTLENL